MFKPDSIIQIILSFFYTVILVSSALVISAQVTSPAPARTASEAPAQTASEAQGQTASEAPAQTASEAPARTASEAPAQTASEAHDKFLSKEALSVIKLDGYPDFLTADGNDVWVTNVNKVQKLSIKSLLPVCSVEIPDPCGAPVVANGFLYIASCRTRSVYKISTATGKIIKIISTGISDLNGEISLAFGAGSLWILSDSTGILSRINVQTGKRIAAIKVLPHSYCAVYGYGSVWVSNSALKGSVQRIDITSNRVISTIYVGPLPHFLAAGENGIWTLNQADGTVSHINPLNNKLVATIKAYVAGSGGDIDTGPGKIWVRSKNGTSLISIDPVQNKIINHYLPLCGSGAVRVAGDYIWVTAHDIHTVWVLPR